MSNLEKRIAEALEGEEITSAHLVALIEEVEAGIAAAESTAATEREAAFDPTLRPNAAEARQVLEDAEFAVGRLRTMLPRLARRLNDVAAAERHAKLVAEHEELKARRDAAVEEFRRYPALAGQIVDLFVRVKTLDDEMADYNRRGASGQGLHLDSVELTARRLSGFTRDDPSVIDKVTLPEYDHSNRNVWPPRRVTAAVLMAEAMTATPADDRRRYGPDWHEALSEANAERRKVAEQRVEQEAADQAARREAYERSLLQRDNVGA